ncbi:MAG: hypothetical protein LBQ43_01835 [Holosporales bacterium]|nr:hypothetical protein [Holosporales bacterium]
MSIPTVVRRTPFINKTPDQFIYSGAPNECRHYPEKSFSYGVNYQLPY